MGGAYPSLIDYNVLDKASAAAFYDGVCKALTAVKVDEELEDDKVKSLRLLARLAIDDWMEKQKHE